MCVLIVEWREITNRGFQCLLYSNEMKCEILRVSLRLKWKLSLTHTNIGHVLHVGTKVRSCWTWRKEWDKTVGCRCLNSTMNMKKFKCTCVWDRWMEWSTCQFCKHTLNWKEDSPHTFIFDFIYFFNF